MRRFLDCVVGRHGLYTWCKAYFMAFNIETYEQFNITVATSCHSLTINITYIISSI